MDFKNILSGGNFGSILKYFLIGAVAVVIPGLVTKFIPQVAGSMLAIVLLIGGYFLMGKVPYAPQAMVVAAGTLILGPIISNAIGSATSAVSAGF